MPTLISKDGTEIAYDKKGTGRAVILVDGAFGHRQFGPNPALAEILAHDFTVYTYDRRGRGDSGDTAPYSVAREVEDLASIIGVTGETPCVFGISSGAALALEAACHGLHIKKLLVYEAPFIVDTSRPALPANYVTEMEELLASNRHGKAVKLFMNKGVGVPAIFVFLMQFMPAWQQMKNIAPTVMYDTLITAKYQQGTAFSAEQWRSITVPTMVVVGGKSPEWMQNGMSMLADTVPDAMHFTLEGQTHIVDAGALAPVVKRFFND